MRTRIKVCGITSLADARMAVDAGADALGFIHYPPSPRHIELDRIASICSALPPCIQRISVLVNPDIDLVTNLSLAQIDCIQFHGDETPQWLSQINIAWYKRISLDAIHFDDAAKKFHNARALLADTPTAENTMPGGTGQPFDWMKTKRTSTLPLILAGGLSPHNISKAIALARPYAVDVNSGVESSPGKKDPVKLAQLVEQVYLADQRCS